MNTTNKCGLWTNENQKERKNVHVQQWQKRRESMCRNLINCIHFTGCAYIKNWFFFSHFIVSTTLTVNFTWHETKISIKWDFLLLHFLRLNISLFFMLVSSLQFFFFSFLLFSRSFSTIRNDRVIKLNAIERKVTPCLSFFSLHATN